MPKFESAGTLYGIPFGAYAVANIYEPFVTALINAEVSSRVVGLR